MNLIKSNKSIHQTRDASSLQWHFLRFPSNLEVKEPWPENNPQYLSEFSRALLCLFFWQPLSKQLYTSWKHKGIFFNRLFYLEINKGQEVEKVCGRRTGLTVVWEGPSLRLRYYSSRQMSLATGFKVQYHILNKSFTEGQFNFITKCLRETF